MQVDYDFQGYFEGHLRQVFLYLTDNCNLNCDYCLYKTTLQDRKIDLQTAISLLELFYSYGAEKLTLIGGEPTLYDIENNNQDLFTLINLSKNIGYKYVRLDTNGQFKSSLLHNKAIQKVDDIAFSLDSNLEEKNDEFRGKGSFKACIERIKETISIGYPVSVTCCVHNDNYKTIESYIDFLTSLGVKTINFHPLIKMGIERDNFTGRAQIDPTIWVKVYAHIRRKIDEKVFGVNVRIPKRFTSKIEYNNNPEFFNYCPVRLGERVLIHPDGKIRICALCIGDNYSIADYNKKQIIFKTGQYSEISNQRSLKQPCMSQLKNFGQLMPLCISFKPFQNEYIWMAEDYDKFALKN